MSPINVIEPPGNFLLYLKGSMRVAEWDSPELPRRWGITDKEDGTRWSKTLDSLNETDREAILDAFKLLKWADEFPLERLKTTSPAKLIEFRRQKEKELGLHQHQVFRDGVTYPESCPAELYG